MTEEKITVILKALREAFDLGVIFRGETDMGEALIAHKRFRQLQDTLEIILRS